MHGPKYLRPADWCCVFSIFAVLGTAVSFFVFRSAPESLFGCLTAGLATGVSGIISWALICGGIPDRVIACLAGILTGILVHPIYLVLAGGFERPFLSLQQIIIGSCFSLLVLGIITIPAGIFAAILIREMLDAISPPISTDDPDRIE